MLRSSPLPMLRVILLSACLIFAFACKPAEEEGRGEGQGGSREGRAASSDARPGGGSGEARRGGEGRGGRGGARGEGRRARGGGSRGGGPWGGSMEPAGESGVPVELATIQRDSISSFFESSSTLEAENEVDVVARVAGPIVERMARRSR